MTSNTSPQVWSEPKPGKTAKGNEDAFVIRSDDTGTGWLIVLSDGASSSAFAASWARQLADAVSVDWFAEGDFDELLDPVRKDFDPLSSRPDADFILVDKWNEEGSHATVAAAWVRPGADGVEVSAFAVGDSVIGIESSRSSVIWPVSGAEKFTSRPALVSSQPGSASVVERTHIHASAGDLLFSATDGVGKWIAANRQDGVTVVRELMHNLTAVPERGLRSTMAAIGADAAVDALNDDLTLVCLAVLDARSRGPTDLQAGRPWAHQPGRASAPWTEAQKMTNTPTSLWPVKLEEYVGAIHDVLHGKVEVLNDQRLHGRSPNLDIHGNPSFIKGGLGWVMPFDGDPKLVLKLFIKGVEDRVRRYPLISRELSNGDTGQAESKTFVSFDYQEQAIAVERDPGVCWFPYGLVMDWCTGERLDVYVDRLMSDGTFDHARECSRWLGLVAELRERGVAHGDLNHKNVYVSGDSLRLIDYDGMYVPAMRADFGAVESGLHGYQRPSRLDDGAPFDAGMDDFSHLVILTTLAGLTPEAWTLRKKEGLVLTHEDLLEPKESLALKLLAQGPEPAAELVELLTNAIAGPPGSCVELDHAAQLLGYPLNPPPSTSAKYRARDERKRRVKLRREAEDPEVWELDFASLSPSLTARASGNRGVDSGSPSTDPIPKQRSRPRRRRVKVSSDELAALGRMAVELSTSGSFNEASFDTASRTSLASLRKKFSVEAPEDLLTVVQAQGGSHLGVALTRRQQQVLELRSAGAGSEQIARFLGVQTRTVERHLDAARKVLNAATDHEAIGRSLSHGLIDRARGLAEITQVAVEPKASPQRARSRTGQTNVPRSPMGDGTIFAELFNDKSLGRLLPEATRSEYERVMRERREHLDAATARPLDPSATNPRRRRFGEWLSDLFASSDSPK